LIADLRPATLDRLGLEAALETLAARSRGLGLEVSVSFAPLHGPGRYAPDLETAIYRIVQEALTNARTHGGAQHAGVRVEESGDTIRVSVQDDGRGFDPTAPSGGFGLVGMRERAGLLAGTVDVDSTPGAGATVTAVLPSG
jgi:signal transduction histidine kinase